MSPGMSSSSYPRIRDSVASRYEFHFAKSHTSTRAPDPMTATSRLTRVFTQCNRRSRGLAYPVFGHWPPIGRRGVVTRVLEVMGAWRRLSKMFSNSDMGKR